MKMDFIPFEHVGIFKLDDKIEKYTDILSKYKYKPANEYGDEYYYSPEYEAYYQGHYVMVTEEKICAVFCYGEVIYNNHNLIGLTIDEFEKITNSNYVGKPDELDIFEDEPPMYDYEFEEIGVTVTTHYGKINSLTISGHWSYEDD